MPEQNPVTALVEREEPSAPAEPRQDADVSLTVRSAQEARQIAISDALAPAYQKASTLELTDAEADALMAEFPDECVEVRWDGLIWIPHIHISDRLNKIFKPGKWALIRRREWFDRASNDVYGDYVLLIRGCYVGEAVGCHRFESKNNKMNYSDALESSAAEALRRIAGKRLSCGSQVWNPAYSRYWVAKYAVRQGANWKRRDPEPGQEEARPQAQRRPAPQPESVPDAEIVPPPAKANGAHAAPVKKTWQQHLQAKVDEMVAKGHLTAADVFHFLALKAQEQGKGPMEQWPDSTWKEWAVPLTKGYWLTLEAKDGKRIDSTDQDLLEERLDANLCSLPDACKKAGIQLGTRTEVFQLTIREWNLLRSALPLPDAVPAPSAN